MAKTLEFLVRNAYLLLACLLLAVSGWLLWMVRGHPDALREDESILVLGGEQAEPGAQLHVSLENKDDAWTVVFDFVAIEQPTAQTKVSFQLSSLDRMPPCFVDVKPLVGRAPKVEIASAPHQEPRSRRVFGRMIQKNDVTDLTVRWKPVTDMTFGDIAQVTVSCRVLLIPSRDGGAGRKVQIWRADSVSPEAFAIDASPLVNSLSATLSGGSVERVESPDANRRLSVAEDAVLIRWRSEEELFFRDVWLLAIGALLGLAGACLVEWLRPFLEISPDPTTWGD